MVVITATSEIKVKISPKRLFKALSADSQYFLPKIVPTVVKSVDILEGDGGAGSIRQFNYTDAASFSYFKEKLAVLDTVNLSCKYEIFEGGPLGAKLESLHSEHKYEDSGDGGSIIKFTTEFHTKGNAKFSEEDIKAGQDFGMEIFALAEQYLLAHPDVCA